MQMPFNERKDLAAHGQGLFSLENEILYRFGS